MIAEKESGFERKRKIFEILAADAGATVARISQQLGVSEVTIRNDLNALGEQGLIWRARGRALPAFHPEILERQKSRLREKERIAEAAAALVQDGDKVMISAGTTTSLIPKFLLGRRDVHLVTNSTLLLPYARTNPSLHVTFVGGEFRPSAEAMVGPIAVREIGQFHVKTAFVGTDGFSERGGVTAHLVDVAEVVRKMAGQAETVVVLGDSTKYGKAGFAHILPLGEIDLVITDRDLAPEACSACEAMGLALKIV